MAQNTRALAKRARGLHPKKPVELQKPGTNWRLPEYLEQSEVEPILSVARQPLAKLLILLQWRAGLRVSEAVAVTAADCRLDADLPTIRVAQGKGGKSRIVPVHPELQQMLGAALAFGKVAPKTPLVNVTRQTALRWVKEAAGRAEALGSLGPGRRIGTHTFRHSFARHCLQHGIPINFLSRWLGHSSISTPWSI